MWLLFFLVCATAFEVNLVCDPNMESLCADIRRLSPSSRVFGSLEEAVEEASHGSSLYVGLSVSGPLVSIGWTSGQLYAKLKGKNIRSVVEVPDALPDGSRLAGVPPASPWYRMFQGHGKVGDRLLLAPSMRVAEYTRNSLPATIYKARVAGYDRVAFDVDMSQAIPVLMTQGDVMVLATSFNNYRRSRFSPFDHWASVLVQKVLRAGLGLHVDETEFLRALRSGATVKPTYGRDEKLPHSALDDAIGRSLEWWRTGSRLLYNGGSQAENNCPAPYYSSEDKSVNLTCVNQGRTSVIQRTGHQNISSGIRSDCNAETAMVFALGGDVSGSIALLDYVYRFSVGQQQGRADPKNNSFGFISWGESPGWVSTYYGDDNARVLLATAAALAQLEPIQGTSASFETWTRGFFAGVLANLRTQNIKGFRRPSLDVEQLESNGWKHYADEDYVFLDPHYESWIWADYYLLGSMIESPSLRQLLYARADTGIDEMIRTIGSNMDNNQWNWVYSTSCQYARMILPLAYAVRAGRPHSAHRLMQVAGPLFDLIDNQTGALREYLGNASLCAFGACPPPSNDKFYTGEGPIIQHNGDPASDLLYTLNFALIGTHEAFHATKDETYLNAAAKMQDYVLRIQVSSPALPELDGSWFRGFDFHRWEHFASTSDWGWGPFATETGWIQSWTTAFLHYRKQHSSMWEKVISSERMGQLAKKWAPVLCRQMDLKYFGVSC